MNKLFKDIISALGGIAIIALGYFLLGHTIGFVVELIDSSNTVRESSQVLHKSEYRVISCSNCDSEYPEKYAISGFNGDEVCPDCAQDQIMFFTVQMADAFDSVENDGVYLIEYDFMLVATSMCNHCGEWAPALLYDMNDEHICFDCMNEAVQNKNVSNALNKYFEYG